MSASEPLAHLYDLALRALDEQERRAEALRGRLGPVLAAAALGASLLSGTTSVTDAAGVFGPLALVAALGGLAVSIVAAFRMLRARERTAFEPDLRELAAALERDGVLEDSTGFYGMMIWQLGDQFARNAARIDRLAATFTAMLCGTLVMLCGLALAAVVG